MDFYGEQYGEVPVDDMLTDFGYHINTGEMPELFNDEVMNNFVASLDDYD